MRLKNKKMKLKVILLLFVFLSLSLKAQENKMTTFQRMLILNDEEKMMVVKIKDKDFWVTPGLYQNTKQTIKEGIDSIAETYGLQVFDIAFRAMYGLSTPTKNAYSTRNMFVMKVKTNHTKIPAILDKVEWLTIDEAMQRINIPHINFFIKDIFDNQNSIRFGTVEKQMIDGKLTPIIVEEFYSFKKE